MGGRRRSKIGNNVWQEIAYWFMVFVILLVDLLAIISGFAVYAYYGSTKVMVEALLGSFMNITFLGWVWIAEHH